MPFTLLIAVHFHDGRYHGAGDWPPSPARLFQALVAGAAAGATMSPADRAALAWLEKLDPPEILSPPVREGQACTSYMPNNDLDAVPGKELAAVGVLPGRIAGIRSAIKQIRPWLFDVNRPLFYCWQFENDPAGHDPHRHATTLIAIAERLYQFGRGVDMAWATAEVLDMNEANTRLEKHGGAIHRPDSARGMASGGKGLDCPAPGSLQSLIVRHEAMGKRLQMQVTGKGRRKKVTTLFTQPPRPRFRSVAYNRPPTHRLYDLRRLPDPERGKTVVPFATWPLTEIANCTESVRDKAAARLRNSDERAGGQYHGVVDRVFGRVRAMAEADKTQRLRITPLPSIGHPQAEASIRRILLEIPPDCPLPHDDIAWAFDGLHPGTDEATGEIVDESAPTLVAAADWRMAGHYGLGDKAGEPSRDSRRWHRWHTVTPAALPVARRRIDPQALREERGRDPAERTEAKAGRERAHEEACAAAAVRQALRHAGIETPPESIQVQREPWFAKGARAEAFAPATRFSGHRLWHVAVTFTGPRAGPVVIGDGRYLGLGLMQPVGEGVTTPA